VYAREPGRFRREVAYWAERHPDGIVVVDWIQQLLESLGGRVSFVMTGSSARELKRGSANLLGGRAWPFTSFPLTSRELGRDFDLGSILRFGSLPPVIGRTEGFCRRFLYRELDWPVYYWRTAHGAEVDAVLETERGLWAVEIKSGASIPPAELGGLRSFREDRPGARLVCVGDHDRPFKLGDVECLPWRAFFEEVAG
jgi:predicted AAA+ superfamily ATPase